VHLLASLVWEQPQSLLGGASYDGGWPEHEADPLGGVDRALRPAP